LAPDGAVEGASGRAGILRRPAAAANDTEPPVAADEGRHCVEIIQAAYESSRTGKAVYLPL
jgi:predicted dehydrogenase